MSDPIEQGLSTMDYVPPRKYRVAIQFIDDTTGEVILQDSRTIYSHMAVVGFKECLQMFSVLLMAGARHDIETVKAELKQMAEEQ